MVSVLPKPLGKTTTECGETGAYEEPKALEWCGPSPYSRRRNDDVGGGVSPTGSRWRCVVTPFPRQTIATVARTAIEKKGYHKLRVMNKTFFYPLKRHRQLLNY